MRTIVAMKSGSILIPPIKCQGIKTKIVPFIQETIQRDESGLWIEPFVGSGVVAFNIQPKRALLADKNRYIIELYREIQAGRINSSVVRKFLEYHGTQLEKRGADYYTQMRDDFNRSGDPLYFLFLNRADFNGMIRFNKNGQFNVPFCQKPNRFSKAYITKICNQVSAVENVLCGKDWKFECCSWQETFNNVEDNDYFYLDPPYIGRDTSYVGEWPDEEAIALSKYAHETRANVCLSMWKENEFRKNDHLYKYWSDFTWHEINHFYHFGGKETNRHPMIEVLAIKR